MHLRSQTPRSLASAWLRYLCAFARVEDLPTARHVSGRLIGEDRDDLDGVRGLSRARATEILARASTERLTILDRRVDVADGFVKYLFRAGDGALFETVRLPLEKPRWSVCVSSQSGCGQGRRR